MAPERQSGPLDEAMLQKLTKNMCMNNERIYVSLELGKREGLRSGYPRLTFTEIEGNSYLEANEPAISDPGYEQTRPLNLYEMLTFVQVARNYAPEAKATQLLVDNVTFEITKKRNHFMDQADLYSKALDVVKLTK